MKDLPNQTHWTQRTDLAAAFRWTARLNMHEAVANHFSLAVSDDGARFLINPAGRHFSRITASSLIELARLWNATAREGMTIVPIKMYFNDRGIVKIKLGVAKGKKQADKRETSAKRDWDRQKARIMKQNHRD